MTPTCVWDELHANWIKGQLLMVHRAHKDVLAVLR